MFKFKKGDMLLTVFIIALITILLISFYVYSRNSTNKVGVSQNKATQTLKDVTNTL